MEKPRAGLMTFVGEWIYELEILNPETLERIEDNQTQIAVALERGLEVVDCGVVHSKKLALEAAEEFRRKDIDLLIVCHHLYDDDSTLLDVIDVLEDVPLLIWCYAPDIRLPPNMTEEEMLFGSGPLGSLQAVNVLKRLGKKFHFVSGSQYEREVVDEMCEYAVAAKVAKQLRRTTIAQIPDRCEMMTDLFIDEFRFRTVSLTPSFMDPPTPRSTSTRQLQTDRSRMQRNLET